MKHFTRQFTHSSEYAREINQSGPVVRSGTIAADAKERQQPSPEIAALVRFFVQIIHALSHATGATTMPSAPREWGPWPPDQERVNLVMRKACKALARQIKDDPRYAGVILLAEPKGAPTFDLHYGPGTTEVTVGSDLCDRCEHGLAVLLGPINRYRAAVTGADRARGVLVAVERAPLSIAVGRC